MHTHGHSPTRHQPYDFFVYIIDRIHALAQSGVYVVHQSIMCCESHQRAGPISLVASYGGMITMSPNDEARCVAYHYSRPSHMHTAHTPMIDGRHTQTHKRIVIDTHAAIADTRPLRDLYCVDTTSNRARAGHAESLYIKMRNPELSFSSRAKKTNKGSPPPASRVEVPIAPCATSVRHAYICNYYIPPAIICLSIITITCTPTPHTTSTI